MSVRIAILDPQPPEAGRDWAAILAPLVPNVFELPSELPVLGPGDLLILHGWERPATIERLSAQACEAGFYLVVVSGGGFAGTPPAAGGPYHRRAPVATRWLGPDLEFGACVKRFLRESRESGRPLWSLLEPDQPLDYLIALQLCLKGLAAGGEQREHTLRAWESLRDGEREARLHHAWSEYTGSMAACVSDWRAARLPEFDSAGRILAGEMDLSRIDAERASAAVQKVLMAEPE